MTAFYRLKLCEEMDHRGEAVTWKNIAKKLLTTIFAPVLSCRVGVTLS